MIDKDFRGIWMSARLTSVIGSRGLRTFGELSKVSKEDFLKMPNIGIMTYIEARLLCKKHGPNWLKGDDEF